MKSLGRRQISTFLKKHSVWSVNRSGTVLTRTIKLDRYIDGLILIARIAVHAELLGHHPDITFKYNSVTIKLTTHDVKGLTKLDTVLAEKIDMLCD